MPFFHKSENFLRPELIYPDIFISYSLIGKVHFLIKRKERRNTVSELGKYSHGYKTLDTLPQMPPAYKINYY